MRLAIGTAVAHGVVDGAGRHVADAMEVVHAVLVGNVFLSPQDVDDGRVNLLQFLFRRHGHSAHGLVGILPVEESAVADHERLDAGIGAVEERLQATAGHAGEADVPDVNLLIQGRLRVGILRIGPVDALYLLLRPRHGAAIGFVVHRNDARCQNQIAVGGNLVEEFVVFPRRIGAGAVAPYQHGQPVAGIEGREVLRLEHGVLGQRRCLCHHDLVRACAAILNDTRLGLRCRHERQAQHANEQCSLLHFSSRFFIGSTSLRALPSSGQQPCCGP